MKTEIGFALEGAAWPTLVVEGSGIIRYANQTAIEVLGPIVEGGPQLSGTIWTSENESPEEFFLKWDRSPAVPVPLKFKIKGGAIVAYATYVSTYLGIDQKYYVLQLVQPIDSAGAETAPVAHHPGEISPSSATLAQKQKLDCALQLTRTVALDFNNALTSVLGHTSLVLSKMPADHPWRISLMEVEKAAEKAAEIAHDLAVFSRQEKDNRALVAGNINDLLRRTVELFNPEGDVRVQWTLQLEPNLFSVVFDEAKLQQALIKIMDNAIQAVGLDERFLVVTRNLDLDEPTQFGGVNLGPGRYVLLEISDNGPGIPEDILPRIFEPFFTTKPGHRGLGLALVYGIISNHGGNVSVSSAPGRGTAVRVYLPAIKRQHKTAIFQDGDLRGNQTVLIVDDEKSVLTLGQIILSSSGYQVLTASSGQRALEIISEDPERVDLVITDLVMPQMSGRELIGHLRAIAPHVRVICSSGYVRSPQQEDEEPYLAKPFTSQELLRKVKEVLAHPEA